MQTDKAVRDELGLWVAQLYPRLDDARRERMTAVLCKYPLELLCDVRGWQYTPLQRAVIAVALGAAQCAGVSLEAQHKMGKVMALGMGFIDEGK